MTAVLQTHDKPTRRREYRLMMRTLSAPGTQPGTKQELHRESLIRDCLTRDGIRLSAAHQQRRAVLLAFCEPADAACMNLQQLSAKDWQLLLYWLDTSGLALYFYDRIGELELWHMLPTDVLARLRQNLTDNAARTHNLIAESAAIHRSFQQAELVYATSKGFSLWPLSVPTMELRSQLDLDFLVEERSAHRARRILEARGYRLRAAGGDSWEFKTDHPGPGSIKDLYRATPQFSVELHVRPSCSDNASLFRRLELRAFAGTWMPVLPPAELFLGQGLHAYKHVCSSFSRAAHLIEFRRHVLARHHDDRFWNHLRRLAQRDPHAPIALGVVTLLISRLMGDFAPDALTRWTVDRLPPAARLWVDLYGHRTVLGNFPGSKLYLLLQGELQSPRPASHGGLRQSLLPLNLPASIAYGPPGETLRARLLRYRRQLRFVAFRLRFHVVEGLRYLCELPRWRRRVQQLR